MRERYRQWMYAWETRLTTRDTNRVVRPLDWGLEWTEGWPSLNGSAPLPTGAPPSDPEQYLHALNRAIVAHSDEFFSYATPTDFRLETRDVPRSKAEALRSRDEAARSKQEAGRTEPAEFLRFTSPAVTPYPENNLANARWFPARSHVQRARVRHRRERRAVIVLPQWNSDQWGHNALCRIFNRFGISALRLSMPYHDVRMPRELERADYAVSANIGRTLDAGRQAVLDIRSCLDWLQQQGYTEFGIVGTSLGSCYAFLASAHDARLTVNAFNHGSLYVGDVTWTGQSTRHIRTGVEGTGLDMQSLRNAWLAISPNSYFDKFARFPKTSLIVYARYDLTFLPEFSEEVVRQFERYGLEHEVAVLPCGHYTTGETPFKFMDAFYLARFLARKL